MKYKVEMTIFKLHPSNDGAMWVLDTAVQYIYSSLRQSAMLSKNDTRFILSIKAHGLHKPHLSACWAESHLAASSAKGKRDCSRWLTVLSGEGINEVGIEWDLTRIVRLLPQDDWAGVRRSAWRAAIYGRLFLVKLDSVAWKAISL